MVFHELIAIVAGGGREGDIWGYRASVKSFVYLNDPWNGPFGYL